MQLHANINPLIISFFYVSSFSRFQQLKYHIVQHTRLPAHITVRTPSPVAEHVALQPLPTIQEQSLVHSHGLSVAPCDILLTSPSSAGHNDGPQTVLRLSQGYQHQYISIHSQHRASRTANSLQLALEENAFALRSIPWVMFNKGMFCRCRYKALLLYGLN